MKKWLWLLFAITFMAACDTEKMQRTENGMQQNFFLQSVELVESAGEKLKGSGLTQQDIETAMQQMDQGLKQAYQVDRHFLAKLDARLPRFYSEQFIPGVEQYRIGVESGDKQLQLEGLSLLSQWGKFWIEQKTAIQNKLVTIND